MKNKIKAEKFSVAHMMLDVIEIQSAKKNKSIDRKLLKVQPSSVITDDIKQTRSADGKQLVTLIPVAKGDSYKTLQ